MKGIVVIDVGVFAQLAMNGRQLEEVMYGIEAAVEGSFASNPQGGLIQIVGSPRITADEMKRRTEMCVKMFRRLRGDLGWSIPRILDHLPRFLRAELNGEDWEPDTKHSGWVTSAAG